jgi:ParB-like chromosome segregation protein Spo0J
VELEQRTTAPSHATGTVEFVPLSTISSDAAFRLREVGDVSALAGSVARLGQLGPIELRPLPGAGDGPVQLQVVAGFRRLAAVRLLGRSRVLARVHAGLDEDDAWALALTQALLTEPLAAPELEAVRARLAGTRHQHWAEELVELARVRAPLPPEQRERYLAFLEAPAGPPAEAAPAASEGEPTEAGAGAAGLAAAVAALAQPEEDVQEVTLDELAEGLAGRLWQVNQDLSLALDAWGDLPAELRRAIVKQARYMAELYPYLTRVRP